MSLLPLADMEAAVKLNHVELQAPSNVCPFTLRQGFWYEKRTLRPGEKQKNAVLHFNPDSCLSALPG